MAVEIETRRKRCRTGTVWGGVVGGVDGGQRSWYPGLRWGKATLPPYRRTEAGTGHAVVLCIPQKGATGTERAGGNFCSTQVPGGSRDTRRGFEAVACFILIVALAARLRTFEPLLAGGGKKGATEASGQEEFLQHSGPRRLPRRATWFFKAPRAYFALLWCDWSRFYLTVIVAESETVTSSSSQVIVTVNCP